MLLLLLGLAIGLAIPVLAVPRLGVAAHVNAVVGALFLLALGLMWSQLRLGARALGVVFCLWPARRAGRSPAELAKQFEPSRISPGDVAIRPGLARSRRPPPPSTR
jgi:hypothetical protein